MLFGKHITIQLPNVPGLKGNGFHSVHFHTAYCVNLAMCAQGLITCIGMPNLTGHAELPLQALVKVLG